MAYNGPAIKGVSVAERMEAGAEKLSRGRVLVPARMSEAWRGFCCPVASFLSFTSVAVQGLLRAGHLSPYTDFIESSSAIMV
jgi:class 3 adenylate cyclase